MQATIKLIDAAKTVNDGIKTAILLNAKQPNTQLSRDATDILSGFDAVLLKTALHLRQAYGQSVVLGGTVHDVPGGKPAVTEVEELTDELLAMLGTP